MKQLELTATEKAEIMRRGLMLRELMKHEAWGTFAFLFKNAVERLDSIQEVMKRDGIFPLTRDNIALQATASTIAMEGMNQWMDTVLQEVDRAVKLKERLQKQKTVDVGKTTRRIHREE